NTLETMRRVDEGTKDILIGDLGGVQPLRDVEKLNRATSLSNMLAILNGSEGRVFQLDRNSSDLAENGFITSVSQVTGELSDQLSPVDDVVWVDLDSFDGHFESDAWKNEVRNELTAIRERGLTAVLT